MELWDDINTIRGQFAIQLLLIPLELAKKVF